MRSVRFIPYVCSAGGKVAGSERAGHDLYDSSLCKTLQAAGVEAAWQCHPDEDYNEPQGQAAHTALPPRGSAARREIVLWHGRRMQGRVADTLRDDALPVTLGGDHTMALASISALAQAKQAQSRTGLLWIDAHADINTPETSPSQALHGMPVAALLGLGDPAVVALTGPAPVIHPSHVVYIGLRDLDAGEVVRLKDLNIMAFGMDDITRLGIDEVMRRAATTLEGTAARALSIDLDAFDPVEAPSVGSPVPGGLKAAEFLPALTALARQTGFDLIEIAEYNPALPGRDTTYSLIETTLTALLPAVVSRRSGAG